MSRYPTVPQRALVCALLFVTLARPSRAQTPASGTLIVRIASAAGADVTAHVTAESRDGNGLTRTLDVQTGGTGIAQALPPAVYRVRVAAPGLAAAEQDVTVGARAVVQIEARLAPGSDRSEIVQLDRGRDGTGTDFDAVELTDLPVSGIAWSLLDAAAPFVVVDRISTGGLDLVAPGRLGSHGASWTATSAWLDGVRVGTREREGTLTWVPVTSALQSLAVTEWLAPVDVASPGAAIDLAARSGAREVHGGIEAAGTSSGLVASGAASPGPIERIDTWRDAGTGVGGPAGEHGGLFASVWSARASSFERGAAAPDADLANVLANATVKTSGASQLRVTAAVQRSIRPFAARRQMQGGDATERDLFVHAGARWTHASSRAVWAVDLGGDRDGFTPRVGNGAGAAIDRLRDGAVQPPPQKAAASGLHGRVGFSSGAMAGPGGWHALRAGAAVDRLSVRSSVLALPTVPELVAGVPARVWVAQAPVAPQSRRIVTMGSVWLDDRIELAPAVSLDVGVRADLSNGSADGAAQRVAWRAVSPRAVFRWSPAALTLFGGYRRYHTELREDVLAFGDPGAPTFQVFRWDDANHDATFTPNELGPLVALDGRGAPVGSIDPALKPPYTDELALGAERRFGRAVTIGGSIIARWPRGPIGSVDVGVPVSAYDVIHVPDAGTDYDSPADDGVLAVYSRRPAAFGGDTLLLTNPAAPDAFYGGIEVFASLRTARWDVRAGATAYRSDGSGANRGFRVDENDPDVVGERFVNPNATSVENGRTFFDRAYVLKWSAIYRAPHDVHAGVVARYQDGQPFARVVVVEGLGQGAEMVPAYPQGKSRFTFTLTLDLRLEKGFSIGGGRRLTAGVDAFNLPNFQKEVEEDPRTGPTFRQTTFVQPPRTIRIGVRIEF